VPIPAFYDAKGEPILDAQIVRNAAALIETTRLERVVREIRERIVVAREAANWTGAEAVAKSNDTLDVWIDSGSSSRAVIARRPEIAGKEKAFQADMYLEGSDQHRGWFQSSLLLSLAGNGAAPFKTVLTHGFMVDADREKISKSKQGGYEKPQTAEAYVKKYGADVVRLWVASQDFRSDIVVSEERINKVGETYRGIRNALRYQLSNLYDFDPAKHTVADDQLTGLDRWILGEFAKIEADVVAAYDKSNSTSSIKSSASSLRWSCPRSTTTSSRIACTPTRRTPRAGARRRPRLSPRDRLVPDAVADSGVHGGRGMGICSRQAGDSVHLADWKAGGSRRRESEVESWKNLFLLRELALPELEKARQAKLIGKSLEAKLTVNGSGPLLEDAKLNLDSLRELLERLASATGERWRRNRLCHGHPKPTARNANAAGIGKRTSVQTRRIRHCAGAAQKPSRHSRRDCFHFAESAR
jgi:isoleucyl-tRNA synthetase